MKSNRIHICHKFKKKKEKQENKKNYHSGDKGSLYGEEEKKDVFWNILFKTSRNSIIVIDPGGLSVSAK